MKTTAPATSNPERLAMKNSNQEDLQTATVDTATTVELKHLHRQLDEIQEDLAIINRMLKGNGEMGLDTKVQLLWKTYHLTWTIMGTSTGVLIGWCLRAWAIPG